MANNGSSSCVDVIARALGAKAMNRALVTPISAPTEKELVGIGTGNEQIRIKLGSGLSFSGATSPFSLEASGGSDIFGDVVWTNPTPSAQFSGQTIDGVTFATGHVYALECRRQTNTENGVIMFFEFNPGFESSLVDVYFYKSGTSDAGGIRHRLFYVTSDNKLTFGKCLVYEPFSSSPGLGENNGMLIPVKIYKIN